MKSLLKIAVIIHLGAMLGFSFFGSQISESHNIPMSSLNAAITMSWLGPMMILPIYLPCLAASVLGVYFVLVKPLEDALEDALDD